MAIRTQVWRPDTCGCVIQETYDTADVAGTMVGTPISKCSIHAGVADNDHYGVIYSLPHGENKRKNEAIKALKQFADLGDLQQDGSYEFKNGITATWVWSGINADRIMTVTITGITLSTQKKNQLQNAANAMFGAGKVVIVN